MRDSFADLVMEKHEMMALGINSEWTPLQGEEAKLLPPKPLSPKPVTPKPPPTPIKK
ncbi:hypothetical protein TELCIR_13186 [Teladorsagia circumcincta]|uniref:Uncharacterized protein n=1 Tax=Teladorsagia circumcincta TaxID=45464 RepID=A0A2G9U4I3_TELCI|nr:hypothetical protein TELCIR_13186 [Teladorsagia circumcincta]